MRSMGTERKRGDLCGAELISSWIFKQHWSKIAICKQYRTGSVC